MLTGSPPLPRVGCRIPLPLPPSLVLYRVLPPPLWMLEWWCGAGSIQLYTGIGQIHVLGFSFNIDSFFLRL